MYRHSIHCPQKRQWYTGYTFYIIINQVDEKKWFYGSFVVFDMNTFESQQTGSHWLIVAQGRAYIQIIPCLLIHREMELSYHICQISYL